MIGEDHVVEASYGHVVSFGIRRCEFDDYLLRRSAARLLLGASISTIRRASPQWIVNNAVSAPMLVGAGGHFCPVGRMLNGGSGRGPVVAAQEVELPVDQCACEVAAERPELYFCPDLAGYGWCFRKGNYVNVGFGRLEPHALVHATEEFVDFLRITRRISVDASSPRWRGHAYLLSGTPRSSCGRRRVMLVGDAAGLAYPQSGEGIRPAIESGSWPHQRSSRRTAVTAAIVWSHTPDVSSGDSARVPSPVCCRAWFQERFRRPRLAGCSIRHGSCDASCWIGGFCMHATWHSPGPE